MGDERPLILVTNDDGITAGGIQALAEVMTEFGEVIVVAPDKPQSGMGHAVTINQILRLEKVDFPVNGVIEAYSTSGTPVDCVKLAIYSIINGRKPDLLVSGVNHGANSSINVIYSGTMSAAVEGAVENIPSIGFSLLNHDSNADFSASQEIIRKVVAESLEKGIPDDTCLNVNIPDLPFKKIKGIKVCRQARAFWEDSFETKKDPSGKDYFWLTGVFKVHDKGEDTDEWALEHGYVSVVPTHYDLTAHHAISQMNTWNL
ncbi:MAG: 5'/3'-nucleotidase SurE [Flavobacteriales bacterium]|nr:5'/3'-nucleotidase SurE [Flavobacteriales bacterium]